MACLELVQCRLAIQCCIGYFPDGRERHRTFSLRDIRPDASVDALAAVVRSVAPLLVYPITKVSIVKKYVLVLDAADAPAMRRLYSFFRAAPLFSPPIKGDIFWRRTGRTLVNGPAALFSVVVVRSCGFLVGDGVHGEVVCIENSPAVSAFGVHRLDRAFVMDVRPAPIRRSRPAGECTAG